MKTLKSRRKTFLLLAMLLSSGIASAQVKVHGNVYGGGEVGKVTLNTSVVINGDTILGCVYGGGKGLDTVSDAGLVKGNTKVEMKAGYVERSIYGGGELGSVGTYTVYDMVVYTHGNNDPDDNDTVYVPRTCDPTTGLAEVYITGGQVGLNHALMPWPGTPAEEDNFGYVFAGGQGDVDTVTYPHAIAFAVVDRTYLEIDDAFITASAYGGCENGLVLNNTHVKINGGQIGAGFHINPENPNDSIWDAPYTEEQWEAAINAVRSGDVDQINNMAEVFHECDHWPYEAPYAAYDVFYGELIDPELYPDSLYLPEGGALNASDGHSFFGNVFGGGSGYYPYAPGKWRPSAGDVRGNTLIEINGGHILTSVYGSNEITDVEGKSTVIMRGGTVGTPRTLDEIKLHPVTCYLFGGGMGDPRVWANKFTDVNEVEVDICGGTIFGSVFGGGEEGHVLGDVNLTVRDSIDGTTIVSSPHIGTFGYSYVDGNIFGGGRGYSGEALTAGNVGGNVHINIESGTMLGSIYGGGRLASVGPALHFADEQEYGQMQDGEDHGYVNIHITGGTIGNDHEAIYTHSEHTFGGNVYGGSMGRLTLLDNTTNVLWPRLARVKNTNITIEGENTEIKGNVYGGSEYGSVTENTLITIKSGTIYRDVYGGGRGSDSISDNSRGQYIKVQEGQPNDTTMVMPYQRAGIVDGNTKVNIHGGWIKKSVYGGGELSSVGTIVNDTVTTAGVNPAKTSLNLSWPYRFEYADNTGNDTINITGGRIGMTGKDFMGPWRLGVGSQGQDTLIAIDGQDGHDLTAAEIKKAREDNGDVYGASRGHSHQPFLEAHGNNVKNTVININFANLEVKPENYKKDANLDKDCITGAVYGGGENGHVIADTRINFHKGLIGHAIYGGGKGKDTYADTLHVLVQGSPTVVDTAYYSITSGKVYGNTYITIDPVHNDSAYVVRSVFGGGNLASVGKGNYIGYGESTSIDADSTAAANSGHTYVNIYKGTLGMLKPNKPYDVFKDTIPYGSVFGGCRGWSVKWENGDEVNHENDRFGFVNNTFVKIGNDSTTEGPRLFGSVYGGGQDGHVRRNAQVTVNSGEIGVEYRNPAYALSTVGDTILDSPHWIVRGNVFGGGSGVGRYDEDVAYTYSPISGSVIDSTKVVINGGLIHRNVFGGGNLSRVEGATTVIINDTIGLLSDAYGEYTDWQGRDTTFNYGGFVFGAGRGFIVPDTEMDGFFEHFATSGYSKVILDSFALVPRDVYGGGRFGQVDYNSEVDLLKGTVMSTVYGAGRGHDTIVNAALVKGNAKVDMRDGEVHRSVYGGGELASVGTYTDFIDVEYGADDPNGNAGKHAFVPSECTPGTGVTTVLVSGGHVGYHEVLMPRAELDNLDDDFGYIFGGGRGDADSISNYLVIALAAVDSSHVKISGTAHVTASVYGGSENGLVLRNTHMWIDGGQIGTGHYKELVSTNPDVYEDRFDDMYSEALWQRAIDSVLSGDSLKVERIAAYFHQCDHWAYNPETHSPHDIFAGAAGYDAQGGAEVGLDGHSYFGNVFGGGSGFYPIAPGVWRRYAGLVKGNTKVEITGGHILNNVYGGNEYSEVMGNCVVEMRGGTLGIPRPLDSINSRPVTCYLFGGNMGDQRPMFDGRNNVGGDVIVTVSGGTIFGSIFGGCQDAHVLGDVSLTVKDSIDGTTVVSSPLIGTFGYSYVDGNVFGGGRGFTGEDMRAGIVEGDVDVNIEGGTMLGSIYGGGRLASVIGDVTVDISGGTIGNKYESVYHHSDHTFGGNVFGGSMGRLTLLNGEVNEHWPLLAQVNSTTTTIGQAENKKTTIMGNVYGGSEYGTVLNDADLTIEGGTIWRNVFGGGRGSDDTHVVHYTENDSTNAMRRAGRITGNTSVNISGGWVKKSVYGGGELASVGTPTSFTEHHESQNNIFPISWPVAFNYQQGTGKSEVNITGGRIGITGKDFMGPWNADSIPLIKLAGSNVYVAYDKTIQAHKDALKAAREDNGDVYGGGKGSSGEPYVFAHSANVDTTKVTVCYSDPNATPTTYKPKWVSDYYANLEDWTYGSIGCIAGALYGGGENGHVNNDADVTLTKGLVGHAVYGGGKGKDKYVDDQGHEVYSLTSGKVYGNTYVTVDAPHRDSAYVVRNVFGGGNTASVGKGNYKGYGETGTQSLADGSGKCFVTITGGTLGMLDSENPGEVFKDTIPYGSVFGGCRGLVETADIDVDGTIESRLSYVNNTEVVIGDGSGRSNDKLLILGSVFGGSQDGRVRWNTDVTVNEGEIGVAYIDPDNASAVMGSDDVSSMYWLARGSVFGGGSGWSQYEDYVENQTTHENDTILRYSINSGAVMGKSAVEVKGGLIHQNVYGGGALASVGDGVGNTEAGHTTVRINSDALVGVASDVNLPGNGVDTIFTYGGCVFGGGRGIAMDSVFTYPDHPYSLKDYCNVDSTAVIITGGHVLGEVYGGGENGHVFDSTFVTVQDSAFIGTIGNTGTDGNVYGGGKGSGYFVITGTGDEADTTFYINLTCGRVGGNTHVTMTSGSIKGSIYGGGNLAMTGVDANANFIDKNHGNAYVTISTDEGKTTQIGTTNDHDLLYTFYSVGDVFGSGKGDIENYCDVNAGRVTNTKIDITGSPVIQGSVFGGGEMASIGYWDTIIHPETHKPIKTKFKANTGAAEITISGNPSIGTSKELEMTMEDEVPWTIFNEEDGSLLHTCTGNVFGGGQGEVDTLCPVWISMARSRTASVTISGGHVMSKVFGGSEQGSVAENTHVIISDSAYIGSYVDKGTGLGKPFYFGSVFGSGYGSDDPDEASSTYENDSTEYRAGHGLPYNPAVLAGRVYGNTLVEILGGTIAANVHGGGERAYTGYELNDVYGNVRVNIGKDLGNETYAGSAIFRGKETGASVFGANKFEGTPFGSASVHVYKTGHEPYPVTELGNWYPKNPPTPYNTPTTPEQLALIPNDSINFAIHQVFGGGDQADYTPHIGHNDTVHVYLCDENTVYDVYGGGNFAKIGSATAGYTTNSNVIIDGGRMHRVFGGGHGNADEGISADIYGTAYTTINAGLIDELYGGGNNLGNINEVNLIVNQDTLSCGTVIGGGFGGGNEAPNIGEIVSTLFCYPDNPTVYGSFYGGSNEAVIYGNVILNVLGGYYDNIFGGSKGCLDDTTTHHVNERFSADILRYPMLDSIYADTIEPYHYTDEVKTFMLAHPEVEGTGGNVTLNIYGGNIKNAFGGSDVLSQIDGKITVNVVDFCNECGLDLINVYGGGNLAAYYPIDTTEIPLQWPEVNVVNGTVKGVTHGGGKGLTAVVATNPLVNVGMNFAVGDSLAYVGRMMAGDNLLVFCDSIIDTIPIPRAQLGYINEQGVVSGGNVYGGGDDADVLGNTTVNVTKYNTRIYGNVFGGGLGSNDSLPDITYALVHGSDTVRVSSGKIRGHVFGGGQLGSVMGNTLVEVSGGEIGEMNIHKVVGTNGQLVDSIIPGLNIPYYDLIGGRVYGGGQGNDTTADGHYSPRFGHVFGNANVFITDSALVHNCVYGGGQLGSVGNFIYYQDTDSIVGVTPGTGNATVTVSGGEIGPLDGSGTNAYVFGAGRGKADIERPTLFANYANVYNSSTIVCDSARIYGSIFGGSEDGHVIGDAHVQLKKSAVNNPTHDRIPVVGTNGKTSWDGNIFGGGRNYLYANKTAGSVRGNIYVDMSEGELKGNVYGGGRLGLTGMNAAGDSIAGFDHGYVTVNISGGTVGSAVDTMTIGNVFGGGKGIVESADGQWWDTVFYPNNVDLSPWLGRVKETQVTISDSARIYGSVYGGGELAKVMRNTNVTVSDGLIGSALQEGNPAKTRYNGSVYGGSKGYEGFYVQYMPNPGEVYGKTTVNIEGGQVLENVYGGGEMASVIGNANVNISGGQIGVEQVGQADVSGGNVFGGGLGRPGSDYVYHANVDSTKVRISDSAYIINSVFGGGDDGHVLKSTVVTVEGGTIGKPLTMYELMTDSLAIAKTHIYTGSVLAGGRGISPIDALGHHNDTTGRVFGNTNLTVTGGTIRHAVYGGGGLSSVGTYTIGSDGLPEFTQGTGKTTVTVEGNAFIGPRKADLINPGADLDSARVLFNNPSLDSTQYVDLAFRFLGLNEGWVFGAGCGLAGDDGTDFDNLTFNDSSVVNFSGRAQVAGLVFGGGENGRVMRSTEVNITGGIIGGYPLFGVGEYTIDTGEYKDVTLHHPNENWNEIYEDEYGAGANSFRGSVFGGGKGSDTITRVNNNEHYRYSLAAGQVFGNTNVTISDSAMVYNNVYGGGAISTVGKRSYYHYSYTQGGQTVNDSVVQIADGNANVTITGDKVKIGSFRRADDPDGLFQEGQNNGNVFGGGLGRVGAPGSSLVDLSYLGNTHVEILDGAKIPGSVYGGSANGHVAGNTHVVIDSVGTTIGTMITKNGEEKVFGTWHSNVYGGGGGTHRYNLSNGQQHHSITSGRVFGNTKIEIRNGHVLHNVYGGGALASVGTYNIYNPAQYVLNDSGNDTIIITGGTIGVNGQDNGMVYGSGRGVIDTIDAFMDSLTYAVKTVVIIGDTTGATTSNDAPIVKGSVYGSGESGHVYEKATVEVYNGTIGYSAIEFDTLYTNLPTQALKDSLLVKHFPYRGNVYGAGCGTDQFISIKNPGTPQADTTWAYNPKAGWVQGNTEVNIKGGFISHNVYGGGAMASVGYSPQGTSVEGSGLAKVNLSGGQVGIEKAVKANPAGDTGGNVFGGARGIAGGRVELGLANVDSTNVNISDDAYIVSAVFGGGDDGHVMNSTVVNMKGGTVGMRNTLAEFITDSLEQTHCHIYTGSVLGGGRGTHLDASGQFNDTTGRVFGNTYVTIKGGTVRHAAYGGGGLASIGTYSIVNNVPSYSYGGHTHVTIDSVAFIGPRKDDLIHSTLEERQEASLLLGLSQTMDSTAYVDAAFKYLGGNAGWVFGAGCGLAGYAHMTANDSTFVTINGNAQVVGSVYGGGENGHVMGSTVVNVKGGVIGGIPLHGDTTTESMTYHHQGGEYDGVTVHLGKHEGELTEDEYGVGRYVFRGNVYGGGKGTDMYLDSLLVAIHRPGKTDTVAWHYDTLVYSPSAGRVYGNTNVTISDSARVYNRVYGAGSLSSVGTFTYYPGTLPAGITLTDSIQRVKYHAGGVTHVNINGGVIGTDGSNNGDVVGGGRGVIVYSADTLNVYADFSNQLAHLVYVANTNVTIDSNAVVKSNVYGGSLNGHVHDDTHVTIKGGTIGDTLLKDGKYVVRGRWHSNVFGGGGGTSRYEKKIKVHGQDTIIKHFNITSGRVFGNTNIEITGGHVLHNVYGGGAIASVGTYDLRSTAKYPLYEGTGTSTVTITGGTIGVNGDNNGMVYGSGRGVTCPINDYLDSLSYAGNTIVTIGTRDSVAGPKVNGSVYGSGENGHVFEKAIVNVHSGTVGCTPAEYTAMSPEDKQKKFPYRGNVYGAGCGTDTYNPADSLSYNPKAGMVQGSTEVNITGGYISRNVYGGGAMASVGLVDSISEHHYKDNCDSISWPVYMRFVTGFIENCGETKVTVTGGHIGTVDAPALASGDVFGASRGKAGDRYKMGVLSHVRKTTVEVNDATPGTAINNTADCIVGSVYGSGENGHVNENTNVTINNGLIGGSVFGGGKGTDMYNDSLLVIRTSDTVWRDTVVHSVTAGKVYGNTYVTVNDGTILHNVFGGGNMASVGKSNYILYGEGGNNDSLQNSGHCYVTFNGGTIGDVTGNNNGYLYGSSKGITFPAVTAKPRYNYSRDFFLGYCNNAHVIIGDPNASTGPQVFGSVFGGGEDGHVRLSTEVTINKGEIGIAYDPNSTEPADEWKLRGNVYGAGRGIEKIGDTDKYCPSAGSVTQYTHVVVNDGTIHRNVYGGGSLATVGPPPTYNDTTFCTVDIKGGTIGDPVGVLNQYGGSVYGSSRGEVASPDHPFFNTMATVKYARVNIGTKDSINGPTVYGSVYGSGENGHLQKDAMVCVYSGTIGITGQDSIRYYGNVYGGGSGIDMYDSNNDNVPDAHNPKAGIVQGHTRVFIDGGTTHGHVFGGGNTAVVDEERVVTVSRGLVKGDVFGGSNNALADTIPFLGLKTVNVRGGHIEGSVFGSSNNVMEGDSSRIWSGFVNITGGRIDQNVYAAGKGGSVDGSLCVNIGATAILSAPTHQIPVNPSSPNINAFYAVSDDGTTVDPTPDTLVIAGSLFGGSHHAGNDESDHWHIFDITGATATFVDGDGYDTGQGEGLPYMNIGGGVFGSGEHCESGAMGREIIIKDYGQRNSGNEFKKSTRTLTTIQRGGIVLLDNANVNLKGDRDISGMADTVDYGVLKVDLGMYVSNGSGIVLGDSAAPAYMDSIRQVKSLYLKEGLSSYNQMGASNNNNWYVIGIQNHDNHLYRIDTVGSAPVIHGEALEPTEENAVIFKDISKLWVRYHVGEVQNYGELQGFFRMRGDSYHPHDLDVSFAYARPKITEESEEFDNTSDGGWLSYRNEYNYFTDNGTLFTKTKQHPYINVLYLAKGDREEYRMWVDPQRGRRWYVDGRENGWGRDDKKKYIGCGLYPDKPKKTIFGTLNGQGSGIVTEGYGANSTYNRYNYSYKEDVIYIVGALSAKEEAAILQDSIINDTVYPLRLFRYPGGHPMSNDSIDFGGGYPPATLAEWGVNDTAVHSGPGANYGALLDVEADTISWMRGVILDGLYGFDSIDKVNHMIPTDWPAEADSINFHQDMVTEPMVVTHSHSTLDLYGGTELKRGYNNTNADVWYTDADYAPTGDVHHGGAVFVDSLATVNVSDSVLIVNNKQYLKIGDATAQVIESNVYLPTFFTSLNISDSLVGGTRIGVTSPKRNKEATYLRNTLSPVAVAPSKNIAKAAWQHCNFYDDLKWFFVNGHTAASPRSTYYDSIASSEKSNNPTLCFGWTWANVVRKAPVANASISGSNDFSYSNIDHPEDLAWLISNSFGLYGQPINDFSTVGNIEQTDDIDLKQYVWVPIGDSIPGTGYKPFAGNYDGRGHLITNLSIDFIGKGDLRYERNNYGLFGYVKGGWINRTFVVSGLIRPVSEILPVNIDTVLNIGGMVGYLDGASSVVSNSEAAVDIYALSTEKYKVVAGGLVANVDGGLVHSSMAMPNMTIGEKSAGTVGGLVGNSKTGRIENSFVNAKYNIESSSNKKIVTGGLLGVNESAKMSNCYMALQPNCTNLTTSNFGSIAVTNPIEGNIRKCYVLEDLTYRYLLDTTSVCDTTCRDYTAIIDADKLGYMYADNKVVGISSKTDTTLFQVLNTWVDSINGNVHTYARWARPGIQGVNGDLPVPMLYDFDVTMNHTTTNHQGDFRSVSTYVGGPALQYGGPVRDGSNGELDPAINRLTSIDRLFIYGDVLEEVTLTPVAGAKVSILEDASIMKPTGLANENFANTYVGVTFDNSHENGMATSTPGLNYGLVGMGGFLLPRDWHMLSSPLTNAPLGFNYNLSNGTNTNNGVYNGGDQGNPSNGEFYKNPWVNPYQNEFFWLQNESSTNIRYWMKGWQNSQITSNNQTFNPNAWEDGYFPSSYSPALHYFGTGCIEETDEYGRYPYGMDLFTWYEPGYHWVNFKRNGPNHWHSDENAVGLHEHLDYYGDPNHFEEPAYKNKNEDYLIKGKGYMAAIAVQTYLQSHGTMNSGAQSITLTDEGKFCTGWNLVGNPYHGYLDFDKFAQLNSDLLAKKNGNPFYVVYNADGYAGAPSSAFVYYVATGSNGGAYADRYLHPHQGFFVNMDPINPSVSPQLQFMDGIVDANTNGMLVTRDTIGESPFREWRPNYPLVNLYLSSDKGCSDVTVVEFERPDWGGATKLRELRNGNGLFYGYHEGKNYAALFTKVGTDRVPLWFEAKEDDIFTMKWNTANGNFNALYLIDNLLGVQYDMLANDSYIFEGHKQDYYSRFYIVFDVTGVEENLESNDSFAFFDGSQWVVTGEGELDLIDMQGRILMHDRLTGGQSRVSMPLLAKSVYLLRLVNSHETKVQKIVIH